MTVSTAVLALLAFAGWALSFYFLQVYRGNLPVDVWWIPNICRMSEESCQSITDTKYGRTLGKPNAYWGSFYYPGLILVIILVQNGIFPFSILLVPTSTAVIFSAYLLWGLFRLKTVCRICLLSHILNLFTLIFVVVSCGN